MEPKMTGGRRTAIVRFRERRPYSTSYTLDLMLVLVVALACAYSFVCLMLKP
ncbi:MAG: hypothetical protein QOG91_301 [Candidatus Parcubacteria bacterium]|jgi:hypothetical protein|nr:hypothetical protein [Candidatus Parcubacteria bacterium]